MSNGERIKEIRVRLNLSQVEFADRINVSKQTLYKYENNLITNIPFDKIEAIAKIGSVSPAYLMGWNHTGKPDLVVQGPDGVECVIEYDASSTWNPEQEAQLKKMLEYYLCLNKIGQKKAIEHMEDLAKIYSEHRHE